MFEARDPNASLFFARFDFFAVVAGELFFGRFAAITMVRFVIEDDDVVERIEALADATDHFSRRLGEWTDDSFLFEDLLGELRGFDFFTQLESVIIGDDDA